MTETCGNCKFFFVPDTLCRKNPPVLVPLTKKNAWNDTVTTVSTEFPLVEVNSWCGAWVDVAAQAIVQVKEILHG